MRFAIVMEADHVRRLLQQELRLHSLGEALDLLYPDAISDSR